MSIFRSIMSKIFHRGEANAAEPAGADAAPAPAPMTAEASSATGAAPSPSVQGGDLGATGPAPQMAPVDVEAVLTGLAAQNPQRLDWRHSIVDLMKLLGLDSSLDARRELARELDYSGSTSDTATMNIWLHRQVMRRLAENGGRVPEELRN